MHSFLQPKSRSISLQVSVYAAGDCAPPHIEHHDFERPWFVLSLGSDPLVALGQHIRSAGPGDFRAGNCEGGRVLQLQGAGVCSGRYWAPSCADVVVQHMATATSSDLTLTVSGPALNLLDFNMQLPRRSALVLQGNSANVTKFCVPAVNESWVEVRFRRTNQPTPAAEYDSPGEPAGA